MKSKRVSFSWRATRRRRWASPGTAQNARNTSTDIARPHEKANVAQRPAKREASFSFFLSLFFFCITFSISLWRDASRAALCAPSRNSSDTKRRPKNIYIQLECSCTVCVAVWHRARFRSWRSNVSALGRFFPSHGPFFPPEKHAQRRRISGTLATFKRRALHRSSITRTRSVSWQNVPLPLATALGRSENCPASTQRASHIIKRGGEFYDEHDRGPLSPLAVFIARIWKCDLVERAAGPLFPRPLSVSSFAESGRSLKHQL